MLTSAIEQDAAFAAELELDKVCIRAMARSRSGAIHTLQDRDDLLRWLQRYSVLQGFTTDQRSRIAQNALRFAASLGTGSRLERSQVWAAFSAMSNFLLRADDNSLFKARSVDSMASKLLWLCYPEDVPILDRFAEAGLMVVWRLLGKDYPPPGTRDRYHAFTTAWFRSFDELATEITVDERYPYAVRQFDYFLLALGAPARFPATTDS